MRLGFVVFSLVSASFLGGCASQPPAGASTGAGDDAAARWFTHVEALANDLAKMCLEDPRVEKAIVRVEKPGAVRFSETVGVEVERSRDE